ncbi:MAG: VWA domain-containing protein [Phycisphaerales bacterium JB063]
MQLEQPLWLLLILPLGLLWWYMPAPSKALQAMRAVLLVLIVTALSVPKLPLEDQAGTVVVIADRSASMPANADRLLLEQIQLIQQGMSSSDRLGIVTFGRSAALDHTPEFGAFDAFTQVVDSSGSNLSDALAKALSVIPPDRPGRVLIISDGRWTQRDPHEQAMRAIGREIAIDYRVLSRPSANDVAIDRIDAPLAVSPGQSFMLTAWVDAPAAQEVRYELLRGDTRIAQGTRAVAAGLNRLTFRDTAGGPGTADYRLRIYTDQSDPLPENNTGRLLVGITGDRPVLVVSETEGAGLAGLLTRGGLDVVNRSPGEVGWSLAGLSNYSAVVIENVPAQALTTQGTENLAAYIEQSGGGLLLTGGRRAYGPGGYFKTPLDPLMPVSMELRQEHRKLSLAIVVALDRSGSMAAPVAGGRMKMDLANLGTAQVLDLLSPIDEFGVLAVDTEAHLVLPLEPVGGDTEAARGRILGIDSMGGGIYIYEALSHAAAMLADAEAQTRHIILFADAADSVEPGKYKELLQHCRDANITVSVIGLGSPADPYATLLQDIATRGDGRIFFTKDAGNLPQLFAQDTFVVARSSFLDELTPIATTPILGALVGRPLSAPPAVGGYNLTYLRPNASLGVLTQDEYRAPLVAYWQAGAGRVAAYTGEADGQYTGPISEWEQAGEMFSSLAQWVAEANDTLPDDMLLTQSVADGVKTVTLHLSPDRVVPQPFDRLPVVTTVMGRPDTPPATIEHTMRWTSADTLQATIPIHHEETSLSTVALDGVGQALLSPARLLYAPEFRPRAADEGVDQLQSLAQLTRGQQRVELATIWQDLPRMTRHIAIGHWLMLAAIGLILLEVIERRVGVVSILTLRRKPAVGDEEETTDAVPAKSPWWPALPLKRKRRKPRSKATAASDASTATASAKTPEASAPPASTPSTPTGGGLGSALERARQSAEHRTKK